MKKISFLMMGLAMLATLGFTSCKTDTQPRLEKPTEFVLNTPATAENVVLLQAGTAEGSTINFTVSQPDYGIGVVTSYEVQISYTEDFTDFRSLKTVDSQAQISCSSEEFAIAMCSLMGVETEDDAGKFDGGARPVYVRVKAFIPGAEYSEILSNVVKINVKPYFAIKIPAKIYLIGQPSGWDINNGAMALSEPVNGIGSNIYSGTFEISAEDAASGFRFYTTLGSWGDDGVPPSIGAAANDGDNQAVTVDTNGLYQGPCVWGKGNWNVTNWEGGAMHITVDLNEMTVIFEKAN